ncbi:MAG: MotA/TolQ/ExbB proton channel family protein [Sedimentisphaeraceae bacterium JB056]
MTKIKNILIIAIVLASSLTMAAQDETQNQDVTFIQAANSVQNKLDASLKELSELRQKAIDQKVPLNKKLTNLETKLIQVRNEYQQNVRLLDSRTLDLNNLRNEIKSRKEESTYLSNLLSEYGRNFESRLHIAEIQLYSDSIEEAKLAPENSNLSEQQIYEAQAALISTSLDRLDNLLSGHRFEGKAVDSSGIVKDGTFVLLGPAAIFKSEDEKQVGTIEQKIGSLEPAIVAYSEPMDTQAAKEVIQNGKGNLPFDPTLGNAHVIEATKQTLLEHIQKGGPVMYPILGMAAAALLVAIIKWISLGFIRKPSNKQIAALLNNLADHDQKAAKKTAKSISGPFGKMLGAAIEHIKEPTELIEEIMYEKLLATKLNLQKMLPFVAISAASAPLLGLLGTVTGIINTFKLITVFGSGDVKTLSGGISEALITTEFGLIVAIPSLLLHAFLSRKAQSITDEMEKSAIAVVNQISKKPFSKTDAESESD